MFCLTVHRYCDEGPGNLVGNMHSDCSRSSHLSQSGQVPHPTVNSCDEHFTPLLVITMIVCKIILADRLRLITYRNYHKKMQAFDEVGYNLRFSDISRHFDPNKTEITNRESFVLEFRTNLLS